MEAVEEARTLPGLPPELPGSAWEAPSGVTI